MILSLLRGGRQTERRAGNGSGADPGTIALKNLDTGQLVGEWDAMGFHQKLDFSPGAVWPASGDGPPNRYWAVKPGINLPAGTYEVIDSDRSTWSTNSEMKEMGAAWVYGK